eukprot:TRINITY_DN10287_c0_g1_i2.p1 TRINITY_DN10287_c0_g1~~TRINITY_DN10287_c0_g1_i2.p1  ORF type:complete len:742 (+),score=161.36 TRINITY_DN10287_c0_g1_i2:397-2622(+)
MESQSLPFEGMWKLSSPDVTNDPCIYQSKPVKSLSYHGSIALNASDSLPNSAKPNGTRSASFLTTDAKFSFEENGKKLLQSGTLAKIVEWVVFEQTEVNSIINFIHTFKLHTTANAMLDLLFMLYKVKLSESSNSEMRDRIAAVLKVWFLNNFETDFKKGRLWKKLLDFVTSELPNEYANAFKLILIKKMSKKKQPAASRSKKNMRISPKVEDIYQHQPEVVAAQMTIIVRKLLRAIQPTEFYNNAWQKKDKEKTSPNLTKAAQYFNKVSFWVCTEILRAHRSERGPTTTLKWFLALADKLYELNNFESLMAILSAFGNSSVSRLKKLWKSLPEKSLEVHARLSELMDSNQNFKNYRGTILSKSKDTPIVPYLALYLRDVTFITDGNPDFTEEGLINFEKMQLLGSRIQEIRAGIEQAGYDEFQPDQNLQQYLLHLTHWDEDEIYEQSLLCQPINIAALPSSDASTSQASPTTPTTPTSTLISTSTAAATATSTATTVLSPPAPTTISPITPMAFPKKAEVREQEVVWANPIFSLARRKHTDPEAIYGTITRRKNPMNATTRMCSSAPISIPAFEPDERMMPFTMSLSPSPPNHLTPRPFMSPGSPANQSTSPTSLAASTFAVALATKAVVKDGEEIPLRSRNSDIVRLAASEPSTRPPSDLPPWESFFKEPIAIWVHTMFEEKEILAVLQGLTKRQILDLSSDTLLERGLNNPFQLANVMWILGRVKESSMYEEFIKVKV